MFLKKIKNEGSSAEYEHLINYCSDLQEKFRNCDGYNIEININLVCNGLDISNEIRSKNYNNLSGGEKTLIHLAKTLLQKPDLFLLDEPTNHLDITKIEWLENYIKNFKGAVVAVSHDRSFLDNISDMILEIDNCEGTIYYTNYKEYLDEKEKRFEKLLANWEEQQVYFKRLENEAKRMAQMGMATNSTAMTRKASVLFSRIEREKKKFAITKPEQKRKLKISFDEFKKRSKCVIDVKNLTIALPNKKIIDNINIHICAGERIAIIGANGSGKSSIIRTILGEQTLPFTGELTIAPSVKIGYLPQTINFKNDKQVLLEYFREQIGQSEEQARSVLARFGFDQKDVSKRIGNLSGGERIKIRLASLLQQQINCLIFDEPTNHIDIPTKESLEEAIENFDGTLLCISHDRFFINKFAEKIIEIEKGKAITHIINYDH